MAEAGKYRTDHSGKAEALLSRLLDQPVEVAGSGRTDAGTHAKMQVVSFRAKTQKTTEEILAGLRRYLPADIGAIRLGGRSPGSMPACPALGKPMSTGYGTAICPMSLSATICITCTNLWTWRLWFRLRRTSRHPRLPGLLLSEEIQEVHGAPGESITIQALGAGARFTLSGGRLFLPHGANPGGNPAGGGRGHLRPEDMADILASQDRRRAGETVPAAACAWRRSAIKDRKKPLR